MQFSVVDVHRNMTNKGEHKDLSYGAFALFYAYVEYWSDQGYKTNRINPRNSELCNYLGITKKTFYKFRRELVEKGYIIVESHVFQPLNDGKNRHAQGQGSQKPATIKLADWLIKSDKDTY